MIFPPSNEIKNMLILYACLVFIYTIAIGIPNHCNFEKNNITTYISPFKTIYPDFWNPDYKICSNNEKISLFNFIMFYFFELCSIPAQLFFPLIIKILVFVDSIQFKWW